ncbi:lysosome-associated membrane glycoprotein 1a [Erpetoichthys calabaricus]|uniref:lysosome-associated membrane glycoprotein 1a n=1 Tax=Erpetoichthys calabaricus TaxID=27687 RepID=UPI0022348294|nr:lysosome-associated membrane glycoprotein 1a [Erpetoichthys calabaricus]
MALLSSKQLLLIGMTLGLLNTVCAVSFEVKDEKNTTCIKAELSANFSVQFEQSDKNMSIAMIVLPEDAKVGNLSTCGNTTTDPLLVIVFGAGHELGINFSSNSSTYMVKTLVVTFNLSDSTVFPNSSSKGQVSYSTNSVDIQAPLNTTYRCMSIQRVMLKNVNITFSNVRLEAYLHSSNFSKEENVCSADIPTTAAPKTTQATTPSPTTAPLPNPTPKTYNVTNANGTCLLAKMGLQLNITFTPPSENKTESLLLNIQPNKTTATGSCGSQDASLVLSDGSVTTLTFMFMLNNTLKKFFLSGVTVDTIVNAAEKKFHAENNSLSYLRASFGKSYTCKAEQTLLVSSDFSVNAFDLQIQPFGVHDGQFSAVEECQLDEDNMLIPIIVGAALAGLVLIVLIAYLIGRKRSHAGYQTI